MWGNCYLIGVRQPFLPKILNCYSIFNKCPLGIGQCPRSMDNLSTYIRMCQATLAIGTALCFSDHCGWHSSETKSVNNNSAIDFFQESCKRNSMYFVCLKANYERTHNNDLTVHSKTSQLPRTFSSTLPLILAIFWGIQGRCNYLLPKDMGLWKVKGLVQGEHTTKWKSRDQNPAIPILISLIPQPPTPVNSPNITVSLIN